MIRSRADTDELIRVRLAMGEGQKSLAKDLGVTEWRVRCVARSQVTETIIRREPKQVRLHIVKRTAPRCERWVILSDIHIPYHDKGALAVALEFLRHSQPTGLVLNGDVMDFHEVSTHPKTPGSVITFQDEINEGRQFLRAVRAMLPDAEIVYTMGNHEDRIERYLAARAPELASVEDLSFCSLMDLPQLGIRFVDKRQKVRVGGLEVFHGSIIRKDAGNSARAHMQRRGGSVLMGHTHRLAAVCRTDRHGVSMAIENGHLSDPDPSWCQDPDWQQGFTEVLVAGDLMAVRQHHIRDGRLLADGVEYRAEASDGKQRREEGRGASRRVDRNSASHRDREHEPRRGAGADRKVRGRRR